MFIPSYNIVLIVSSVFRSHKIHKQTNMEKAVSTHLDADTQRQQALLRLAEQEDKAKQSDPTVVLNYQYRLQAPVTTGKRLPD